MNWSILYFSILIIGAAQGCILGFSLLFSATQNRRAMRFLAALLLLFAYRLLAEALIVTGALTIENWTYHVFVEYHWVYGALLFLFVKSYVQPEFRFKKSDAVHFIPVGIQFLFSNFVKTQNFFWDGSRESLSWLGFQSYILWEHTPFQLLVMSGLILYYVHCSRRVLANVATNQLKQANGLRWIHHILWAYIVFSILVILGTLADYLFFDYAFNPTYIVPLYISMAVITYWLGLQGFARRKTTPFKKTDYPITDELQTIIQRLEQTMQQERLYLDPELSLQKLADQLDVKPYLLTQAINGILQKTFTDYINERRVQQAIRLLRQPDHAHYTLLAIGYEAGFNSKASFNRIFKKMTGQSPSQMRDSLLKK